MKNPDLNSELNDAANLVIDRSTSAKASINKMMKALDKSGVTIEVSEEMTAYEENVAALEKLSVAEMYVELDEAMLLSIREMRDIVTGSVYEVSDRISAVKALGSIGSYVNKRRDALTPSSGGGNHVNVIIDNSVPHEKSTIDLGEYE